MLSLHKSTVQEKYFFQVKSLLSVQHYRCNSLLQSSALLHSHEVPLLVEQLTLTLHSIKPTAPIIWRNACDPAHLFYVVLSVSQTLTLKSTQLHIPVPLAQLFATLPIIKLSWQFLGMPKTSFAFLSSAQSGVGRVNNVLRLSYVFKEYTERLSATGTRFPNQNSFYNPNVSVSTSFP